MKSKDLEALLEKYYSGETSLEEEKLLKNISTKEQSFEQALFDYSEAKRAETNPQNFDQKIRAASRVKTRVIPGWRLAAAAVILALVIGYAIGTMNTGHQSMSFDQLKAGLESEGIGNRLKTVFESMELETFDEQSRVLFLEALSNEENMNVRLAIINALNRDVDRELLTRLVDLLIAQDSPMVQLALVDLIVAHVEQVPRDKLANLLKEDGLRQESKDRINNAISL